VPGQEHEGKGGPGHVQREQERQAPLVRKQELRGSPGRRRRAAQLLTLCNTGSRASARRGGAHRANRQRKKEETRSRK
jgi:hypothetical protein